MGTERKELSRVLSNPGNVILSDELYELLEEDVNDLSETAPGKLSSTKDDAVLFFDEETFSCKIKKIVRRDAASGSMFMFVLFAPSIPIDVILDKHMCVLEVSEYKFCQLDHSSIKWKDNHLTIKARRILK